MQADHTDAIVTIVAVLFGAYTGFQAWIVKKLMQHDTALAVLIQQVNPPGEPSLRKLLTDINIEVIKAQPSSKDSS